MHALVSTARFILLVDLETGKVEVVEGHRPEYYGISWFPGSSEIALSHSCVNNTDLVDMASYAASEVGFISEGGRQSASFLSAPHQIVCASDGRVIVTNTGRNRIQVIDLNKPGHIQEAGISDGRWDRLDRDGPFGDHLNSVFEQAGRLYAIAHGHRNGSQLAIFTYPDLTLLSVDRIANVTGAHNVFVEDGGLIMGCHSEAGVLIDLKSGRVLWRAGSLIYTRGLAASADHLFIGESEITSRQNRVSCLAGIWIVDRRTFKTRDYLPLGPYGAVNEVRLVDIPDDAHHGVPLAGGYASIRMRMSDAVKAARLRSAEQVEANARFWRPFVAVLGGSIFDEEGWQCAGEGLFLTVHEQPASALAIQYRLNGSEPSHIALVADYRGHGADENMDAFLLQKQGAAATLQLWRHDGRTWNADRCSAVAPDLPLVGEMAIRVTGNAASISLNGEQILSDIALQNPAGAGGRLGIRALGAMVRPLD